MKKVDYVRGCQMPETNRQKIHILSANEAQRVPSYVRDAALGLVSFCMMASIAGSYNGYTFTQRAVDLVCH